MISACFNSPLYLQSLERQWAHIRGLMSQVILILKCQRLVLKVFSVRNMLLYLACDLFSSYTTNRILPFFIDTSLSYSLKSLKSTSSGLLAFQSFLLFIISKHLLFSFINLIFRTPDSVIFVENYWLFIVVALKSSNLGCKQIQTPSSEVSSSWNLCLDTCK